MMYRAVLAVSLTLWTATLGHAQSGGPGSVQSQPLPDPTVAPAAQPGSPLIGEPEIQWRVENPFKLFTDSADTELHRAAFEALSEDERRTPVLSVERALAQRFPKGWAESLFRRTCWDPERNQFGCKSNPDYLNPKNHRVVVELKGVPPMQGRCEWRQTPLQGKRSAVPRVVTAPCNEAAMIEVPYPGGSRVSVRANGPPMAETDVHVTDTFIVGMGDSFASGEGNPDDPVTFSRDRALAYGKGPKGLELAGYPARIGAWTKLGEPAFLEHNAKWQDQACHRSLYSQQLRVALQLAIEDPHRAVTFAGYACSGAEVINGLFQTYTGNEYVPQPPDRSQISFVAAAQCGRAQAPYETFPATYDMAGELESLKDLTVNKCPAAQARKIDLVLLSVGGNDVGFSSLVANAVLSDKSTLKMLGGWMGRVYGASEAKEGLGRLSVRYRALNRALHNILHVPWQEYDRIILTAYPPMALMEDGRTVCADDRGGMSVFPDFKLIPEKAAESEKVADQLHRAMRTFAAEHKWTFAEAHRPLFNGHGICAAPQPPVAAERYNLADDLRLPLKVGDEWLPYNPADYRPYSQRARWFRTPNDAYLTGNFHMSAVIANQLQKFQSLVWFQLLLAATYSGAFHPTAEGHAVIAEGVLAKARGVLDKYEGGTR